MSTVRPAGTTRAIPRWVLVAGAVAVLLRAGVAVLLRTGLSTMTATVDPGGTVTYLVTSFAERQSARDLAFAAVLGFALWTGRRELAGWMFVMGALVEFQDWLQNVRDHVSGTNTAFAAFLFPLLTIVYALAARRLLRAGRPRSA